MRRTVLTTVALPNGIGPSGAPRLSLFLTLRLESDEGEELGLFPALLDWPAVIGRPEIGHIVEVAGHGAISTRVVSAAPSSELWRAVFRTEQRVRSRSEPAADERAFVSYPYAGLGADLEQRYGELGAASVTRLPSRATLTTALGDMMDVARRGTGGRTTRDDQVRSLFRRADERLAERRGRAADAEDLEPIVLGDEEPEGLPRDLAQFEAFHSPVDDLPEPGADPEAAGRQLDFHTALAALGDHPWLLRELGLVVDLELLGGPFPASADAPGRLRAFPLWNGHEPPGVEVRTPWVAYTSGPSTFGVADRPGRGPGEHLVDGLVTIGDGGWDLVQVDVDGGVLKVLGAAASAAAQEDGDALRRVDDPDGEGLPALRSGGLTLARRSTVAAVHRSLGDQRRLAGADLDDVATALFAADVTRGYRMDVFEHRAGAWRSLQARVVTATAVDGPALAPVHDQGLVRRAVRQPASATDTPMPTYVHDALCRWAGWSLVAPHPGLAVSADGRAPDGSRPETMPVPSRNPAVPGGVPLSIEIAVEPGTLPRLRYGDRYHVRLRAVDLAGNGPSQAEGDAVTAADTGHRLVLPFDEDGVAIVRYEPVGSPELVARELPREGESLAHLVIRSDVGVSAADWAGAQGVGGGTCERHVVPPKTSQLEAERHGMFDAAFGPGSAAAATYEVARREKGRLDDPVAHASDGTATARAARLQRTPAGDYVIDPSDDLLVPYLADPLAEAVTISGAPGASPGELVRMEEGGSSVAAAPTPLDIGAVPEALLRVAFGGQHRWPDVLAFRLALAEGDGPPVWDPQRRVVTLSLPKGGRARIELSCAPPRSRLDELAPRSWARGRHPDAAHVALAEAGRVWQISPARTVELVHAVQRPITAPVISSLTPVRAPGETSVLLTGRIGVHGATSERLDLDAEWDEPVVAGPPAAGPRHVHVLEQPLHVGHDLPPGVAVRRDAIRYDEETDEVVLTEPSGPSTGPVPTPRHELGDTRHRIVRYTAVATTRFREYLPPQVWADPANITQRSEPVTVDIPSSARPQAPTIAQVLPTFAWNRGAPDVAGAVTVRRGGGLRVYLEPPWFSSGEGELLGVVLRPSGAGGLQQPFTTRWGRDPIWSPQPLRAAPTLDDAVAPAASAQSLPLIEQGGALVAVAGYPVAWDERRRLWSCDVALNLPTAYSPFVRLVLVRWQPSSLAGLALSPLVVAELAQPAPDRALTVVRFLPDILDADPTAPPPQQPFVARLQLDGPGPPTRVDVTVQRRIPGTTDEVGWIDAAGPGIVVEVTDPPAGSTARWAARVALDDVNADRFRLLVRESEVFPDGRLRVLFVETLEVP